MTFTYATFDCFVSDDGSRYYVVGSYGAYAYEYCETE